MKVLGVNRLASILGRLYRVLDQRVAKSAHRILTTFLGIYEEVGLSQPAAIEVRSPPYVAYWADSEESFDSDKNIYWDEGQHGFYPGGGFWDDGVSKWDDAVTKWG